MGIPLPGLKRIHAQRLREVYRSAGWPYQDIVEVDLLEAGLLERITSDTGPELIRVTDAGIAHLAWATEGICSHFGIKAKQTTETRRQLMERAADVVGGFQEQKKNGRPSLTTTPRSEW